MSEKIDPRHTSLPWNDRELESVRNVRQVVSEQPEGGRLDRDVAPMMGELLATLEDIVGPGGSEPFPPPTLTGEPLSPRETFAALHAALASVEQVLVERPEEKARLQPMIDVLRRYAALKDEVIHRVDSQRNA